MYIGTLTTAYQTLRVYVEKNGVVFNRTNAENQQTAITVPEDLVCDMLDYLWELSDRWDSHRFTDRPLERSVRAIGDYKIELRKRDMGWQIVLFGKERIVLHVSKLLTLVNLMRRAADSLAVDLTLVLENHGKRTNQMYEKMMGPDLSLCTMPINLEDL